MGLRDGPSHGSRDEMFVPSRGKKIPSRAEMFSLTSQLNAKTKRDVDFVIPLLSPPSPGPVDLL